MSGKAPFRKRVISPEAVARAEASAAEAPINGDPRLGADYEAIRPAAIGEGAGRDLGSSQDPLHGAVVGDVVNAPLTRVKSNPLNPRAVYTTAAVDEMVMSLQANGQQVAATGFLDEEGNVVLIEGETRLRGARAAGLPTLRIELRPKPDSDQKLYESARAANVDRRDQTPLDDAIRWNDLLIRKVYPTQVALANALGLKEDLVSRTRNLASMPHKMILAVSEYPDLLTLKMLNAIREFFDQEGEEETLDLIHLAAKTGMGYRDVVAKRKMAQKPPGKRPRAAKEDLSYKGAKGQIKTFEEGGRLELVLQGLSKEDSDNIKTKIMEMFPEKAA
ncbi:ParB/RepB/Spo0J family partition protein [Duganella vulcania]|uniref:ParB N-terminal domain-containing protein n=1 Tax=Duganella vulcania TaxID=2692166 RepID=A0A845GI71_9BURK|nr:ParB N-terminal domain-containing protein [Duganella vulcania]MYM92758.1 ParB N-terminal domain-containing protein [Duganella vulcania]